MTDSTNLGQNPKPVSSKQGDFIETYWKAVVGVIGLGLFIVLIVGLVSMNSANKEKKAQEALFNLESEYTKFVESSDPAKLLQQAQNNTPPAKVDVEKLKADLNAFKDQNKGLIAAQMAGLYLSDLYVREQKLKEALETLKGLGASPKNLTGVLVLKKAGQIAADLGNCQEAKTIWEPLMKAGAAKFAQPEVKIGNALCLLNSGDLAGAEKILNEMKSEALKFEAIGKDTKKMEKADETLQNEVRRAQTTKNEVEKILRLIQFKSNSGTGSGATLKTDTQPGS